jgi:hypothetical protein
VKAILTAALLAATLVPAQATPMSEADKAQFIQNEMLACDAATRSYEDLERTQLLRSYSSLKVEDWQFRLWSPTNLSDFCGCYSATTSNSYTQEDIIAFASSGKQPADMRTRIVDPAVSYCKKYLPLPDVSSTTNRKW